MEAWRSSPWLTRWKKGLNGAAGAAELLAEVLAIEISVG
jgi:hypothetical protein